MLSSYKLGRLIDFCKGPHVLKTEQLGVFKLLSLSPEVTGEETKIGNSSSGSTALPSSPKKNWTSISPESKRRAGETIADWASN